MEYSEAELRSFIGPRASYYLKHFQRLEHGGSSGLSFNFAAFFFSLAWLLYRRLHRIFWIAIAIVIVETVLSEWVATAFLGLNTTSTTYNQLVTLAYAVTVGTFANALYYRHTSRRITDLRANAATEEKIAQAGGVRWGPPLLFAAVVLSLVILAAAAGSDIGVR